MMCLKLKACGWLLAWLLTAPPVLAELVLYTEDYRPYGFVENGRPTGMVVALVEELIQRTGQPARIEVVPWTRGYHQAQHRANVGLFATVRTARREPLFRWVGPITRGDTSFYSRKEAGLRIDDLDDVGRLGPLAVPREWYSYEMLRERGLKNLYGVSTPQDMVRMFRHGRVQVILANSLTVEAMLAEQGMRLDQLQRHFTLMPNDSYIAFSLATDPALVAQWQSHLLEMRRDGSLERIYRHWLPHASEQLIAELLRPD